VIATMTDGTVSNAAFVAVTAPAVVGITVSPAAATLRVKQSRQFTATVTGTANTSGDLEGERDHRRGIRAWGRVSRPVSTRRRAGCRHRLPSR
jgi:hypothetical protein